VKHALRHVCPNGLLLVYAFCYPGSLFASTESVANIETKDSGFAWLSDAPNVTQWGLGGGVSYDKSPYKGYGSDVNPTPLVYFDNKWVHLYGNDLDLKLGHWQNFSVALHANYALGEGYDASDADILNGMQKRRGGFWAGPSVAWQTDLGTLSANYLLAGNKGQRAMLGITKQFGYGDVTFSPYARVAWLNSQYVDYYYGVRDSEARPGRQAYKGESTYNVTGGLRIGYALTQRQRLQLDANVTHLGSGITNSPLVDRASVPRFSLGYLYQF